MDQDTRWLTKYNEVMEFMEKNHRNPSRHRLEEQESGGQELFYKPLDTIYSLRGRYLSVVYIEKRFSITSSISCLGVQAASPHGLAR